jgi:hypothetical protein
MAAYQRVITSFPTDANALRARTAKARLHEAAGQFEQALGLYDEIDSGSVRRHRHAVRFPGSRSHSPEASRAGQIFVNQLGEDRDSRQVITGP